MEDFGEIKYFYDYGEKCKAIGLERGWFNLDTPDEEKEDIIRQQGYNHDTL